MNVVGCHDVIEHGETESFLGLEHPAQVTPPVTRFENSREMEVLTPGTSGTIETTGTQSLRKRFERTPDSIRGIERFERLELLIQDCCLLPHGSCLFDVPEMIRQKITVGARHRSALRADPRPYFHPAGS
jgi:hypothetical protein